MKDDFDFEEELKASEKASFEFNILHFLETLDDEIDEETLTYSDILYKSVIFEMNYFDSSNTLVRQNQRYGKIIRADKKTIDIRFTDNDVLSLPPILDNFKRAEPKRYRLIPSGNYVKHPDFIYTWKMHVIK